MIIVIYVVSILLLSVVAFGIYGWDKRQAVLERRRIPESTLHTIAVIGGWPGALAGQRCFRHKTRKTSFQLVFWLSVIGHVIVSALVFYLIFVALA